jgi:hypothetical protein
VSSARRRPPVWVGKYCARPAPSSADDPGHLRSSWRPWSRPPRCLGSRPSSGVVTGRRVHATSVSSVGSGRWSGMVLQAAGAPSDRSAPVSMHANTSPARCPLMSPPRTVSQPGRGPRQGPRPGPGQHREAVRQGLADEARRRGRVKVPAIPTGALSLDLALGIGGLPRGRVVEIYGPESSGKCLSRTPTSGPTTASRPSRSCSPASASPSCTSRVTDVSEQGVRLVNEEAELETMAGVTHNNRRPVTRVVLESGRTSRRPRTTRCGCSTSAAASSGGTSGPARG